MGNEHMGNTNGDSAFNKRTIAAALANYIDAGSIVAAPPVYHYGSVTLSYPIRKSGCSAR